MTLSIRAFALDGVGLSTDAEDALVTAIAAEFTPPRPFRLSVFSAGPPATQFLKPTSPKSGLRAPTVTGAYRFVLHDDGTVTDLYIVRISLVRGFDSAVVSAVEAAMRAKGLPRVDSAVKKTWVELRLTTDSLAGGRRLLAAAFPRMMVVDAVAKPNNPVPVYPEQEQRDSVEGDVAFRFVVDRTGVPLPETAMIVRAATPSFVTAAMATIPNLRFAPATINGCAVAQVVDYAFNFVLPRDARSAPNVGSARH